MQCKVGKRVNIRVVISQVKNQKKKANAGLRSGVVQVQTSACRMDSVQQTAEEAII